jgi:hypothetical protein
MIASVARRTGQVLTHEAPAWRHWQGRPVRLVDGATVTLADTEEANFSRPGSQEQGLGLPLLRVVVLLCLGSGALLDAAVGCCEGKGSDEQSLFRGLLDTLAAPAGAAPTSPAASASVSAITSSS